MASIIKQEVEKDHVLVTMTLSAVEVRALQCFTKNIHVLAEGNAQTKSLIIKREKKGNTQYFLIPRLLRKNIKISQNVYCQRFDTPKKMMWVYTLNKLRSEHGINH